MNSSSTLGRILISDPTPAGGDGFIISVEIANDGTLTFIESEDATGRPVGIAQASNQFVYVSGAAPSPGARSILPHTLDNTTGLLDDNGPAVNTGLFNRLLAIDPSQKCLYDINASGLYTSYQIQANGQLNLNPVPTILALGQIDEPVFNSAGGASLGAYTIDTVGALTQVGTLEPVTGTTVREVLVEPTGQFLYLVTQNNDLVKAYSIAPDGSLTFLQDYTFPNLDFPAEAILVPPGTPS